MWHKANRWATGGNALTGLNVYTDKDVGVDAQMGIMFTKCAIGAYYGSGYCYQNSS